MTTISGMSPFQTSEVALLPQTRDVSDEVIKRGDPKRILNQNNLHPILRSKVSSLLERAHAQGLDVMVSEGYRSIDRQNRLYSSGKMVTRAAGGSSFHNYGLAVDFVFRDQQGQPTWDAPEHAWRHLGAIGKDLGLRWGGDFKSLKDFGHFELSAGFKIKDIKAMHEAGGINRVWEAVGSHQK